MPKHREMAVFCDETGTHDCAYFAWGSIWCPRGKVATLNAEIDALARQFGARGEVSWKRGNQYRRFYREVVQWFFRCKWVCFQALLVRKADMRIFGGEATAALAYQKLLCTLLATQIPWFDGLPGGPRQFHISVDEVSETCKSLTLEEFRILSAAARKRQDHRHDAVKSFARVDSRSRRGVQLADLLIGAVRSDWENDTRNRGKRGVQRAIGTCLGWPSLAAYTQRNLKFNLWLHIDSQGKDPAIRQRAVDWKYPSGNPGPAYDRLIRNVRH